MKRVTGLLLVVAVVLLAPTAAPAQTGVTIRLSASSNTITFGEHVTLSGSSPGAPAGSTVEVRNGMGSSSCSWRSTPSNVMTNRNKTTIALA